MKSPEAKKMATEEKGKESAYLVAIFLINFPTPIPTKRNSVKPRNVSR